MGVLILPTIGIVAAFDMEGSVHKHTIIHEGAFTSTQKVYNFVYWRIGMPEEQYPGLSFALRLLLLKYYC